MELAQIDPVSAGSLLAGRSRNDARRGRGRDDGTPVAAQRLARSLGWLSIGLGATEILMPRLFGRAIGVGRHPRLVRALGVRGLASGIGIVSQRMPAGWMRWRVAGDVIDLALLGAAALTTRRTRRLRVIAAGATAVGITALDVLCSRQLERHAGTARGMIRVRRSIAINRPAEELLHFWRNLETFPRLLGHLEEVRALDEARSRWIAIGPDGDCTEGSVQFETLPAGRGTLLRVDLEYRPAGGAAGAAIARLLGDSPERLLGEELRRFKQRMEAGEVPTTEGQPSGRRSLLSRALP